MTHPQEEILVRAQGIHQVEEILVEGLVVQLEIATLLAEQVVHMTHI